MIRKELLFFAEARGHHLAINADVTDQSRDWLGVVKWTYGNGPNPVVNYFEGRILRKVVCLMVDDLWLFLLVFEGRKKHKIILSWILADFHSSF